MTFTCFLSLPSELRERVWETYCPELGPRPQVLDVVISPGGDEACQGVHLRSQTAAVRDVLSLCRDSRDRALRTLPNTFLLHNGRGVVRYAASRDVIHFCPEPVAGAQLPREWRPIPGAWDQVVNLALDFMLLPWDAMSGVRSLGRLCLVLPNLRHVFAVATTGAPTEERPRSLAWCVSPRAHATGQEPAYSWPDVERHEDWARRVIPAGWFPLTFRIMNAAASRGGLPGGLTPISHVVNRASLGDIFESMAGTLERIEQGGRQFSGEELERLRGVWVWPMVSLSGASMKWMENFVVGEPLPHKVPDLG